MPAAKIAPSMLSSDFANLASEAQRMLTFGADWLHMDIMIKIDLQDGHFVPNLTIGAPVIESLRKHTKAYLDCHLMVTNPLDYVEVFGKAGASGFTFHVEVSKGRNIMFTPLILNELGLDFRSLMVRETPADNWQELVKQIKSKGMRPGVALKPGTPIEEVYPLLDGENPVEMVLVMTVEPGFGGQKFMPDMMDKVRTLREKYPKLDIELLNDISHLPSPNSYAVTSTPFSHCAKLMPMVFDWGLQVDGGLGPSTIEAAAAAGANCIVAGSSVFGAAEPAKKI
ncbi:LOW QUALITY PROTEIN: hypothetical protein OSB04_007740 [Centaurea solstitialis]|uniref:Ribulose-phosphate 3-epimerase n=1 Tax=Centaurea solstitialis TaxID=347529 RepID=A0AA38WR12_9ASTR|nr:LOW QUALITY PROTEIN: hypothetical protein OSB04_007740 [Centaurea solstitialis]